MNENYCIIIFEIKNIWYYDSYENFNIDNKI